MTRIPNAPIRVTLGHLEGENGLVPTSFIYRGGRHTVVEILSTWTGIKPWWEDPKAVGRAPIDELWWRVKTSTGGTFELIQDGHKWTVYKSYD